MSIWKRLFRRGDAAAEAHRKPKQPRSPGDPIPLPTEPYVFECRECGKVFDARRRRGVVCPECDASDVELLA
jgi:Zn finger protein HypA/HybF involved in hydrogenase expression